MPRLYSVFGASAAVGGFNWAARFLQLCLARLILVPAFHFFDDFPVVIPAAVDDTV